MLQTELSGHPMLRHFSDARIILIIFILSTYPKMPGTLTIAVLIFHHIFKVKCILNTSKQAISKFM